MDTANQGAFVLDSGSLRRFGNLNPAISVLVPIIVGAATVDGPFSSTAQIQGLAKYPSVSNDGSKVYFFEMGVVRVADMGLRTLKTLAGQSATSTNVDGVGTAAKFVWNTVVMRYDANKNTLWFINGYPDCVIRTMDLTTLNVSLYAGQYGTCTSAVLGYGSLTSRPIGQPADMVLSQTSNITRLYYVDSYSSTLTVIYNSTISRVASGITISNVYSAPSMVFGPAESYIVVVASTLSLTQILLPSGVVNLTWSGSSAQCGNYTVNPTRYSFIGGIANIQNDILIADGALGQCNSNAFGLRRLFTSNNSVVVFGGQGMSPTFSFQGANNLLI